MGRKLLVELTEPIQFQVVEARIQNITRAEGVLLQATEDSLILSAESLWSRAGVRHPALGARVAILRNNAANLQEKRVSATRTAIALGAGAVGLGALIASVSSAGGGQSGGEPPGKQQ
ncbi:MAG: hypothetical protein GTO22_25730 [Gemmatimonadales bacterium]|nr:hypothetical protein [Gemmatimonadales bacterium]